MTNKIIKNLISIQFSQFSFRIEDQWVLAKDFVPIKRVTMSSLPPKARVQLNSQLYNCPHKMPSRGRKLRPQPRSTALS